MIQIIPDENLSLIHLKYVGHVSREDYEDVLIPYLNEKIKSEGPFSAVADLREMTSFDAKAIWDDFNFGIHHMKDFKRLATVGDQWWIKAMMDVSSVFFSKIELKHFKGDQFDEALKWVKEK